MQTATLDVFRGMVQAAPANLTPEFVLVPVTGGYELVCSGFSLQASRGGVRVFKTADAAVRYVSDHIAKSLMRTIDLRFQVVAGGLF